MLRMDSFTELKMNYTGRSMNPTLKPGDVLKVIPYEEKEIRAGDVIVFCLPGPGEHIVHRVVSIHSKGVRTAGDNNIEADSGIVGYDRIVGCVVSAGRGPREIVVHGGTKGRLLGKVYRTMRRADRVISRGLHHPYQWLSHIGIVRRLLSRWIKIRILLYGRENGTGIQLLMGSKVIGRRLPGKNIWQIKRPFRILVDEAALPDQKGSATIAGPVAAARGGRRRQA